MTPDWLGSILLTNTSQGCDSWGLSTTPLIAAHKTAALCSCLVINGIGPGAWILDSFEVVQGHAKLPQHGVAKILQLPCSPHQPPSVLELQGNAAGPNQLGVNDMHMSCAQVGEAFCGSPIISSFISSRFFSTTGVSLATADEAVALPGCSSTTCPTAAHRMSHDLGLVCQGGHMVGAGQCADGCAAGISAAMWKAA